MRGRAMMFDRGPAVIRPHGVSLQSMLLWAGLVVLVAGVYANTLEAPFVFDDLSNIQNNVHARLTALSLDGLFKAAFASPVMNRPVANVSFALNYYLHGYQVWGYHAVNVLIHLTT